MTLEEKLHRKFLNDNVNKSNTCDLTEKLDKKYENNRLIRAIIPGTHWMLLRDLNKIGAVEPQLKTVFSVAATGIELFKLAGYASILYTLYNIFT